MAPTIRLADEHDAPAIARIYAASVASSAATFETVPPDAGEVAGRIRSVLAYAPWLVCSDGEVLGYAYASRHRERAAYRWATEVSVYIDAGHRRSGVGRALYTSLLALLRLQGFHTANAGITLPNAPSVGLHESLGFTPAGVFRAIGFKLGAWHDVGWWQLALRVPTGAPPEPLPPSTLADSDGWRDTLASGLSALRR